MNTISTGDTNTEIAILVENITNTIISLIFQNTAIHICTENQERLLTLSVAPFFSHVSACQAWKVTLTLETSCS